MTLRELKDQIETAAGLPKPTPRQLREDGQVVDVYASDDYRITVYKNGFALAQSGRHTTVVRVDECGAYSYDFDNTWPDGEEDDTPHQFDADYFLDLQWPVRLILTADDQLEANKNCRERKWISKHPEIADDRSWMMGGYSSFEDAILNRMETEEMLKTMTDKQRQVYQLYYKYGYTQEEIGQKLRISRNAVKDRLDGALKKMRKFYK